MRLLSDEIFARRMNLTRRLLACADSDRRPSTDLLTECFAWGLGERDADPEKKTPAKKRASSRTGKR
jgi:hypothetical protein